MISKIQCIERATLAARHVVQQIFILALGNLTKSSVHVQPWERLMASLCRKYRRRTKRLPVRATKTAK